MTPASSARGPVAVSAREADVLTIARGLAGQLGFEPVSAVLFARRQGPITLRPTVMRLVEDTLAKGMVWALVRGGGWRNAHTLAGGGGAGRIWERHPPPELAFSAASFELIAWLTVNPLVMPSACARLPAGRATIADQLLLYRACALLGGTACEDAIATQPAFRSSALCWLGFPDVLGRRGAVAAGDLAGMAELASPAGAVVLEGLERELADRWLAIERDKGQVVAPLELASIGRSEEAVVEALLPALDRAGRRDLASFLVDAGRALLSPPPPARIYTERLDPTTALRERSDARRAAGSLLRALGRVRVWDREHRATRFFDDGYPAAQFLLTRWEGLGEPGFARAEALLQELDRFDAGSNEVSA